MTLIAAFRGSDGIAICADSQETVTMQAEDGSLYDLKKAVQKISPLVIGKYHVGIAGGGNATLIESFIVRAERAIKRLDASPNSMDNPAGIASVHKTLERELKTFYKNDVALCPDQDKGFKLFIAASCPIAQECALWISENMVLRDAQFPELIGWEHALYKATANRFSTPDMTTAQAALSSIYTLTIAKQTSNYVGGDLAVAIVRKGGIWMEDPAYVRTMEDRLKAYESQATKAFLSCADTTVSVPALEDALDEFKQAAVKLHRSHIDQQAQAANIEDIMDDKRLKKLPSVPIYIPAEGGFRFTVEHDRERIQKSAEEIRKAEEWVKASAIEFLTKSVQCSKCQHAFEAKMRCGGPYAHSFTGSCPKCGETYLAEWNNFWKSAQD